MNVGTFTRSPSLQATQTKREQSESAVFFTAKNFLKWLRSGILNNMYRQINNKFRISPQTAYNEPLNCLIFQDLSNRLFADQKKLKLNFTSNRKLTISDKYVVERSTCLYFPSSPKTRASRKMLKEIQTQNRLI